ncbi:MAG: hypothetical protein JXD18_01785 [Anaerolineae bacterium]|nr:hypothetical protein [Anaerolineae bacterium]
MADLDRLAHFLLKPFAEACKAFELLADGDRVAVGVSGGKDSAALLDLLLRYRERAACDYDVVALHVVGTAAGLPDLTGVLEAWFEQLGVAYRCVPLELPPDEALPMDCFRCSRNRRKALFLAADALGCNKVALGHHADDAAATTLLNVLLCGQVETLEPKRDYFDGRITLIRPLILTQAKEIARYARAAAFPVTPPCPYEADTQRQRVEDFLKGFGSQQKQIRANLWRLAQEKGKPFS